MTAPPSADPTGRPNEARNNYYLRLIACSIVLALHVSILGSDVSTGVWALLLFHALVYPHLAYVFSRRDDDIKRFILVDFAAYGACVVIWGLQPFATTAFLGGICMTGLAAGGPRFLLKGGLILLAALLVTGVLHGFYFRANLNLAGNLVTSLGLLGYTAALGLSVFQVSNSLQNARKALKRQNERLKDVSDLAQAVNSRLDLDSIMARVIESLGRLYPVEQLYVSVLSPDGQTVTIIRTYGDILSPDERARTEGFQISARENPESIFVVTCQRRKPVYIQVLRPPDNPRAQVDRVMYDINPPRSAAVFPLMVEDKIIGNIGFMTYHQELVLNKEDLVLIAQYLLQVGTAIRNTELLEEAAQARNVAIQAKRRAEESEAAKSQFLANMSHEIRTPMTAILGYAEALTDPELDGSERDRFARTIVRSGNHLLAIINDILDMSKIQSGKLATESIQVDLVTLLDELDAYLGGLAAEKGLEFEIRLASTVPSLFLSDPTRLRQILLNLGSNAIKFTRDGRVHITLAYDQEQSSLQFDVQDSGIGMTREVMGGLFSAFEQGDASTTRKYGGTGLGLHISRELARLLGGDISVSSETGKGSCFRLTIDAPVVGESWLAMERDWHEAVSRHQEDDLQWPRLSGYVLVAEDNPENQGLISFLLRRLGVRFQVVANGLEALAALEEKRFDLALLDIQMPECGGEEVLERLPKGLSVPPFVALTANVMRHQVEHYLRIGFSECLSKPINRARFIETLQAYLPQPLLLEKASVLLVEDNPVNATVIRRQIQLLRPDALCEWATTGEEALEWTARRPFSLILMDVEMPGMGGIAACRGLRERSYHQPVCMLSGHSALEDRLLSREVGAEEHLAKPVSIEQLEKVLHTYLPPASEIVAPDSQVMSASGPRGAG